MYRGVASVPHGALADQVTAAQQIVARTYTVLGPRRPTRSVGLVRHVPNAYRIEHKAKHSVTATRDFRRWALSMLREAGEFLVGAFQPIREAI